MWPFKKKHKKIEKKFKKIKVIKYKDPVNFQVGYTVVNLKFLDGREFQTIVYGTVEQYNSMCYDADSFVVGQVFINNSNMMAQNFIKITCYYEKVFSDNPNNPQKSIKGNVISAEIGNTEEDFSIEFKECYLVEEEVEDND